MKIPDAQREIDEWVDGGRVPEWVYPDFSTSPRASNLQEQLLTAAELQSRTSVPKTWWLAEARADRIPHIRLGKYVRFSWPTVVQHLREHHPRRAAVIQ